MNREEAIQKLDQLERDGGASRAKHAADNKWLIDRIQGHGKFARDMCWSLTC